MTVNRLGICSSIGNSYTKLLRMRYAQLPIIHRHLMARHLPYEVIRQIEIRQINQQRLYEVIDEDSSEDENSDDETFVGDKQD